MSHHVVAYQSNGGNAAYAQIDAVGGDIYQITDNNFIFPSDTIIYAAYVQGVDIDHARLNVPQLNQVFLPQLRPINPQSTIQSLPGLHVFYPRGLTVKGQQEVGIDGFNAGTTDTVNAFLFISDEALTPLPSGGTYKLRGKSTTTVTANKWTQLTTTWDTSLASGTYAVTGLTVHSSNGLVARLVLPQQVKRPGSLMISAIGNQQPRFFAEPNLGEWCRFPAYSLPTVEVFCLAADSSFDIFLEVVKVG